MLSFTLTVLPYEVKSRWESKSAEKEDIFERQLFRTIVSSILSLGTVHLPISSLPNSLGRICYSYLWRCLWFVVLTFSTSLASKCFSSYLLILNITWKSYFPHCNFSSLLISPHQNSMDFFFYVNNIFLNFILFLDFT